jgi:hypothetical protein
LSANASLSGVHDNELLDIADTQIWRTGRWRDDELRLDRLLEHEVEHSVCSSARSSESASGNNAARPFNA